MVTWTRRSWFGMGSGLDAAALACLVRVEGVDQDHEGLLDLAPVIGEEDRPVNLIQTGMECGDPGDHGGARVSHPRSCFL